ncbi:MAG TPA: TetR/AcrR family transcriptional regulator [Nocardioides sp.]|uniref:TetR/AcrR family transcriptional regulator n=1 Tax=Nocardioides sp. TaxID=35761 RepID=UPI002F402D24
MPRFIDTDQRVADMVTGVNRVVVARGIPGLTMREIARQSGISTGSLMQHFESKERMLLIAAHRTGRALIGAAQSDSLWVGVEAFLPTDGETLRLTRAWVAWCELARSGGYLAETVEELRGSEREALAVLHEGRLSVDSEDTLVALLDGLRGAVCAARSPLDRERARSLLRAAWDSALTRAA